MRYLSIFSGIEAASVAWEPLGWEPTAFAEVDEFPSAVLAHRWPDVPNMGDVTKVNWDDFVNEYGNPDVLVGGPPCQAFSVAGMRQGILDPRGNLTLTYLSIIDKVKPEFIVFENVPGIMSDKTRAFESFLEGLQELGYLIDMDVLDARYFGVAQRRRRVFVVGWRVDHILKRMTSTSRFIIGQILAKTLQDTLAGLLVQSDTGSESSESAGHASAGLMRRMTSFGLRTAEDLQTWLTNLAGDRQRFLRELETLGLDLGAETCVAMQDLAGIGLLKTGDVESRFTEPLWRVISGEGSPKKRSYTTTSCQIYICATALLVIARLMCRLTDFQPMYENEGIIASTALKVFTKYAIRKNEQPSIFDGFDDVLDHLRREAEVAADALGDLGSEYPPPVQSVSQGVLRDTQTIKQKREELAADARGGLAGEDRGLLCVASPAMNAEICVDSSPTLLARQYKDPPYVVIDRAAYNQGKNAQYNPYIEATDVMPPLVARGPHAVDYDDGERYVVRRLTPVETERLQGFPDGHTDLSGCDVDAVTDAVAASLGYDERQAVALRRKVARWAIETPDGQRYKATGNSFAVPVVRWIGRRIEMVQGMIGGGVRHGE